MKIFPLALNIWTPLVAFPVVLRRTGVVAKKLVICVLIFRTPKTVKKVIFKADYHTAISGKNPATTFSYQDSDECAHRHIQHIRQGTHQIAEVVPGIGDSQFSTRQSVNRNQFTWNKLDFHQSWLLDQEASRGVVSFDFHK